MERSIKNRASVSLMGLAIFLIFCGLGSADQKTPTPTPTPRVGGGKSLAEVAKDTQLSQEGTKKTSIVITDENLSEYAEKGKLTTAGNSGTTKELRPVHKSANDADSTIYSAPLTPEEARAAERKNFYRSQYKNALNQIAAIEAQIEVLNRAIPGLWQDFYSRDDPAYRDGVLRPKLDEYMARRERLQGDLKIAQDKLIDIKIKARQDGAEPDWFRGLTPPTPVPTTPTPGYRAVR